MRVVNIALDSKVLNPESVVAFRSRFYGELTEHYSIVVPSRETITVHLSQKTTVYGVGGMNKAIQIIKMYRVVSKLIRSQMSDVITAQDMYFLGLLGLFFARRYHLGLEVQVLGIEKLTWFRKRLAIFILKRTGVIRALSNRLRDRLVTEFGIPIEKINVVSIYVDVHKLGLDVRTLNPEDTRRFETLSCAFRDSFGTRTNFLTVSRLVPIKRIELQLEAVAKLVPSVPTCVLHIVGTGPETESLKSKVVQLKLEEHVIFHGYQTGFALGMLYMECDCFLLTSDYEGWGMVIIEAMTAGLPIIMTDVGCAGELIIQGKSGLIIPVGDTNALKEAMKRIIQEPALREALSTGATHALTRLPSFDTLLSAYIQNWEVALKRAL